MPVDRTADASRSSDLLQRSSLKSGTSDVRLRPLVTVLRRWTLHVGCTPAVRGHQQEGKSGHEGVIAVAGLQSAAAVGLQSAAAVGQPRGQVPGPPGSDICGLACPM
jgi:hypothetical protein